MSGTILEAFQAKIPVLARNNLSNISLIKDQHNGFIFNDPAHFIT
jgi:hypothetical protein